MKKSVIIFIVFLVIFVALVAARNTVIRVAAEQGVRAVTGLPLQIQSVSIGIIKPVVHIKGLQLFNPDGFEDRMMVDIPEIYVDYDLISLIKRKVYLKEVRLVLKEFIVIKNKEGRLNLESLKALQPPAPAKGSASATPQQTRASPKEKVAGIKIDTLLLKMGRVVYKDYSKGPKPSGVDFNLNMDQKFSNITDADVLVQTIVFQIINQTTLGKMVNFHVREVKTLVDGTFKTAETLAVDTVNMTTDVLKSTINGIKNVVELPFEKK